MDSLFEQRSKVSIGFLAYNKTIERFGTKENQHHHCQVGYNKL